MSKKEIIWREILFQALESHKFEFTQKELAEKYRFSLSTVFNALKIPRSQGAIKVSGRDFKVVDAEKFLYIWATQRNFEKNIIYETSVSASVKEIEGMTPDGVTFACYSAYVKKYGEVPADYDKVYIYASKESLESVKKRFPEKKGHINLIVLESDIYLKNFGIFPPDAQTFADFWNLSDWYAKDYLSALKQKMFK